MEGVAADSFFQPELASIILSASSLGRVKLNLIEAMTQAEDFWSRVLQADAASGYDLTESNAGGDGSEPLLARPPLWRFPWQPSETARRPGE